jgi:DNA-binding CsgD family transcriptional regulator
LFRIHCGHVVCKWRDGNPLNRVSALVGRETELARLDAFLAGIESGSPQSLVIEGEPGVGKTALWSEGLSSARARGCRTLVARPVETEAALSFAGLADLLEPVLDETLQLPEPQRRALEIALLLRPADAAPDRRALATAFLNVLRSLAAASPLLVAVDDEQWLDSASAAVVAFAARRLQTEPVAFLLSRRIDGDGGSRELDSALVGRLEHLCPAPLSLGALHRLLQLRFGHAFSRPLREVSGGNPYFTLELARALDGTATGAGAIRELPLPNTLREVVRDRIASLPSSERRLLRAVAALPHPTFALLGEVAGRAIDASSIRKSIEAQVIELDEGGVRFTHPLLGSVVYADAGVASRKKLHLRLADVVSDPEESARHLALATDRPDSSVAARLDGAAETVRARGAPDRAAELLVRAIELTPAGDARLHRRCLTAADYWTDAGDAAHAVPLLERAIAVSGTGSERAEALARLGWIRCRNAGYRDGSVHFEDAAAEAATEPMVRISIEKGLAWADQMLGDLAAAETHLRNAAVLAEGIGEPRVTAESLADLGFIEMLRGRPQFSETMSRALSLDGAQAPNIGRARWLDERARWLNALVLAWTDELDASRTSLLRLRWEAIESGHEHVLPYLMNWLGRVECFAGNWRRGQAYAVDAHDASLQAGLQVERPYTLATVALAQTHLGQVDDATDAISAGLDLAQRMEIVPAQLELLAARGFLELSLGRAGDAYATLADLAGRADTAGFRQPAVQRFHPDLVEAAIGLGELEAANRFARELKDCATALKSPWARALSARCAGLVAAADGDQQTALEWLERALVEHDRLPNAFERGRTLLQRGIVLRRLRRKRDARNSIEAALEIFTRLEARLWVTRAQTELARISGSSPGASSELTETERQIAMLVAAGRANKHVAAELHVTVRTVESNLTRVYKKLGIRSRSQLAARMHDAS